MAFKIEDYWTIWNFLYQRRIDPTFDTIELDNNTKNIAESNKGLSEQLFENTLDQAVFNSDDYKRLRTFLIDWYATLRTVGTTEASVSEVFPMPDTHVQQLIQSFGYDVPIDILTFTTKVNFFFDLVNLYKVKGTPNALYQVLAYYGLADIDIVEYDVQYTVPGDALGPGELVFRGKSTRSLGPGELPIPWPDVPFDEMTYADPHWMLLKEDVEYFHQVEEINLPSRSPYFGIRPRYYMSELFFVIAVLARMVENQYDLWVATGDVYTTDPMFAHIYDAATDLYEMTLLNYNVSLLELYLSVIYTFNRRYGRSNIYPPTWP